MANYCYNEVQIFSGDMDKLSHLIDVIVPEMTLENYAKELGVAIPSGIYMNGHIDGFGDDDIKDGIIRIYTETAWQPTDEYWDAFTESLDVRYASLTDGDEVYCIHNDLEATAFPDSVKLDIWDVNEYGFEEDATMHQDYDALLLWLNEHCCNDSLKTDDMELWKERMDDGEFGAIREYFRD